MAVWSHISSLVFLDLLASSHKLEAQQCSTDYSLRRGRAWLGHVSFDTTYIYAETDLEMKAKAVDHCEVRRLVVANGGDRISA
jgi:hypothetical protein